MTGNVLRFRLSPRVEDLVVKRWGSVEGFRGYVNEASNVKYVFEQQYSRRLAGVDLKMEQSTVLVCGPIKIVIGEPYGWDSLAVPVIKAVINANKDDRNEAFGHRPLESEIQFLKVEQSAHKRPRFHTEPYKPTPTATPARTTAQRDEEERKRDAGASEDSTTTVPRPVRTWRQQPQHDDAPDGRKRPSRPRRPVGPEGAHVDYYPLYSADTPPDKVPVYCEQEKEWRWIRPDGKYCTTCGRALPPLPGCPHCGADLLPHRGLYCPKCQTRLPPDLAVPPEIAISLRTREFSEATPRNAEAVETIADRIRKGRDERRTIMGPVLIVHLEVRNERDTSTLLDANEASAALETLGIGTVITDPYELKVIRQRVGLTNNNSGSGGGGGGSGRRPETSPPQ